MKAIVTLSVVLFISINTGFSQSQFDSDVFKTDKGDLKISFIGHGSLMFEFNGLVIHDDPWSRVADYTQMPKADIILVTHHHGDHLDKKAIDEVTKDGTELLLTELCKEQIGEGTVMANGDVKTVKGIKIEAVPAYNLVHMTNDGKPFHVKGQCNGYVLTFGNKRVYIAGDTENIPEMKDLKDIDIAFLPMNLPYTMTPEMVVSAIKMFHPKIVYPYHYGSKEDTDKLVKLMANQHTTEIRVRKF